MKTKIHQGCAARGRYIISEGTLHPREVLTKLLDALELLSKDAHREVLTPGTGFAVMPKEALEDQEHEWWNTATADEVMQKLFVALNRCAPRGFGFALEGHDRLGFFPFDQAPEATPAEPPETPFETRVRSSLLPPAPSSHERLNGKSEES